MNANPLLGLAPALNSDAVTPVESDMVLTASRMLSAVEPGGLWLLVLGGLSYTVGAVFYAWDRLSFNHAIWHLFVLLGSILHFFSVFFYVLPEAV